MAANMIDGRPIPCQRCFEVKPFVAGSMWCKECADWQRTCGRCGMVGDSVEERYSYGVYAGRLCPACCSSYRDNCGLDQPQGNPADLDEPIDADDEWNGQVD